MHLPSKLIQDSVNAFASLPGIGRKTALRLSLHLLQQSEETVEHFSAALVKMRRETRFCKKCHNISDSEAECGICANRSRDQSLICVVEGIRDVMAIENTQQFNGLYHVLGGVISPIDGIGPDKLNIATLVQRCQEPTEVKEVLMALNPTIEGDTTVFYLARQLSDTPANISTIARGVSFGGELEYADELTLGRSIVARVPYTR